ncbi:hypothetical protein [Methanohalophilus mahii]|nr:hypothetical protein [Methanohalophilus mahii]
MIAAAFQKNLHELSPATNMCHNFAYRSGYTSRVHEIAEEKE